ESRPMMRRLCDETAAWPRLQTYFEEQGRAFDLRGAFQSDAKRFDHFSQQAPHVFADLSKNLLSHVTEALLLELARECGVERHRDAMFAGERVNNTEQRAVKHWLLRTPAGGSSDLDLALVHETLDAMLAYAGQVRADEAIT